MLERYTAVLQASAKIDAASVLLDLQPSSSEHAVFVNSASVLLDLQPSGVEQKPYIDSNSRYLDLQASGTEAAGKVDIGSRYLDLQPSGAEHAVFVDSVSTLLDLQPSGTEVKGGTGAKIDSATSLLDLQPGGVDIRRHVDSATMRLHFDLSDSCEIMAPMTFSGTIVGEARWDWRAVDRYTLEAMERWTDTITGIEVIRC